mgnify:CR=1 FL=1
MWVQAWTYLLKHSDKILEWTLQHLYIILVANACAVVIGVLVGIFISGKGRQRLADIVLYLASIMMTIPSLALYGILMGILSALTLPSIGFLPVVIALTLYGLLPIVRNTIVGLEAVDPAMIDAAKGMGMTPAQILLQIEIPNASSIILAGVRTSVVINVGTAALGAYVGAGGLGNPIASGLNQSINPWVLLGALGAALLAILLDYILGRVEYVMTPKGLQIEQ